jgi:hypothetical protein
MNRWGVGEDRGSKEKDRCPLTHPLVLDIGQVACVGNGILHAYLPCCLHSPFIHLLVCAMHLSVDLNSGWRGHGTERIGCGCIACGRRESC